MAQLDQYQLSATLNGHSADVRALAVTSDNSLISTSRDASAIAWTTSSASHGWNIAATFQEKDKKFISAVKCLTYDGKDYYALGSASSNIALHQTNPQADGLYATEPEHILRGHKGNVCAIDVSSDSTMITGSWDKTAIVWKSLKPVLKITSHAQAVWAVKVVPNDRFLTASADKMIQLHGPDGTLLKTYAGHTDCVRSLALTNDGQGFWSAGNDAKVILWSFDSTKPIRIYEGHTSFVYAVEALPDGSGCVSSGEDGTVRVWQNHELVQSIAHPTISIWTVAVMPNGDIVSGASDSRIRIWTRNSARLAGDAEREGLERELRSRALNKTQVGDIHTTDLPGQEALAKPGKKEGQVIMIKNGDKVEAYQWAAATTTWQQIGEVTDAVGSGRKQVYQGIEYDYVFDVDIADNMAPLKLPFNATDNLYTAAEKFLLKNDLPTSYTDQIVKFLESNTQSTTIGAFNTIDPFTGASSYRPAAGTSSSNQGLANVGGGYSDPFTGSSAYGTSTTATSSQQPLFKPIKAPQYFKSINVDAVQKKITELAASMPLQLTDAQQTALNHIYDELNQVDSMESEQHSQVEVFLDLLTTWPEESRFPLIDICRYLCLSSSTLTTHHSSTGETVVEKCLGAANWNQEWNSSKTRSTNTLLAIRAIANLTSSPTGRKLLADIDLSELLSNLASRHPYENYNKNIRVALATLALNLSILALGSELPSSNGSSLLQYIMNILSSESDDSEVAYRTLVALGNLLSSEDISGKLSVGDTQVAKDLATGIAERFNEDRLKSTAKSIVAL